MTTLKLLMYVTSVVKVEREGEREVIGREKEEKGRGRGREIEGERVEWRG